MNRTEPSQRAKLQPPGWKLQKSSGPAPLELGTSTNRWLGDGPVWATTKTIGSSHSRTGHFGLVQTWAPGIAPTQVPSAKLRDRSPTSRVVEVPSRMSEILTRLPR